MNGFIPNTVNNQTTVAVAVPSPPILVNGGIVTNQQQQQSSSTNITHQLVHYVHDQGVQPQLLIPNRNVIQITNGPQQQTVQNSENGTGAETIYVARQPYHSPVLIGNGTIPGHQGIRPGPPLQDTTITLAPRATLIQQQPRLIHMTPNGLYATTTIAATTLPNGQLPAEMATTLIITKPPPPKCLHCCLACCGLESLWFNPSFHFSRVIALICNILVDLLMILCLLSTNWLTTVKYRQGLWQYCIDADSPRPLPFGLDDHDGCHWGRNAAYIKLSGFFAVACFSLAIIATILTSLGLSSRDPNKKYTFYRFALYINLGALLAIIVSLTLYPAFFYSELHHTNMVPSNRPHWYFGWAYGVGWGAAIFLVGSILLLVCDKETEEIYYQERTIVHAANNHLMHNHQSIKA